MDKKSKIKKDRKTYLDRIRKVVIRKKKLEIKKKPYRSRNCKNVTENIKTSEK
jgi:hypothetical protein